MDEDIFNSIQDNYHIKFFLFEQHTLRWLLNLILLPPSTLYWTSMTNLFIRSDCLDSFLDTCSTHVDRHVTTRHCYSMQTNSLVRTWEEVREKEQICEGMYLNETTRSQTSRMSSNNRTTQTVKRVDFMSSNVVQWNYLSTVCNTIDSVWFIRKHDITYTMSLCMIETTLFVSVVKLSYSWY
jgi:hypothetical protein